jgi:hypothetical protein
LVGDWGVMTQARSAWTHEIRGGDIDAQCLSVALGAKPR